MLNIFPELLNFGFFAPTITRIVVGIFFIRVGFQKYNTHKEPLSEFLGSLKINPAKTIVQFLGGVEITIGIMLIIGLLTQIAALIALIITFVSLVITIKQPELKLKGPMEYIFVLAICTSLLLTGAGAIAIDFPL